MNNLLGLAIIAGLISAGSLQRLLPGILYPPYKPLPCWTDWFDRDDPSGTGDWELLSLLRNENPGKICSWPLAIEARTSSGLTAAAAGEVIAMNKNTGLVCKNQNQKDKKCNDYHVRFSCYPPFCAEPPQPAVRCWTEWFDRDNPSGSGDWELLSSLRIENPGKICPKPVDIEARTLSGLTPTDAGEVVTMDKDTGLVCKNQDQEDKKCNDYRVRFSCHAPYCAEEVCWTDWFDRDNPSGTGDWETLSHLRDENPGKICKKPLRIEVVTVSDNTPATATGQDFFIFNPTEGFVCKNDKKQYCKDYKVRFGCCCDD